MLSRILDVLEERLISKEKEKKARLRMPKEIEKKMLQEFEKWKKKQLNI